MKKALLTTLLISCFTFVFCEGDEGYEHFRSTRIINLHSNESLRAGIMEMKISHRFGAISGGINQFYGLDQATIRIALEYGLTENLMFGLGRSTYQKTVDGFIKYRILTQKSGGSPLSLSYLSTIAVNTLPDVPSREISLNRRLAYVHQLIISSKIHDRVAIQVSPTLVHKNLVENKDDENTSFALALAGKYNLTKVLSLNAEYIPRITGRSTTSFENNFDSFSVGMGVNTRGHFFEFHLTNSFPMIEKGFILETNDTWSQGNIHLGFNIVRDFKIHRPRKK